jgi:hypothetical protein
MGQKIIRLFPRKTRGTPIDALAVVDRAPELFDEADAVHVSVAFTYDLHRAEQLAKQWRYVAPVTIGGPATGQRGEEFEPGVYLRHGYTITSRGCPNRCWFCSVWRREGEAVRTLPIRDGWNVLDDNLLACPDDHIRAVFAMLARQQQAPQFTGGLEAKRLKPWHVEALRALRPKQMFFAYDTPDDLEPLRAAGRMLLSGGFTVASHTLRCYVLCGWRDDTFSAASRRMRETIDAGFMPMAMVWRDSGGRRSDGWRRFQREWARPAIVGREIMERRRDD